LSNIWELFGSNWNENQQIVKMLVPKISEGALNQFLSSDLNDIEAVKRLAYHYPHGSSVREFTHYG